MKQFLYIFFTVLLAGNIARLGLPWWTVAPVAAIAAYLFPTSTGKSFGAGFLAGFILWLGTAAMLDSANGGMLSGKVGILFTGLKPWELLLLTGVLGGLLAGLGALTGQLGRTTIVTQQQKP